MIAGSLVLDEPGALHWLKSIVSLLIFGVSVFWLFQKRSALLYLLPLLLILCLFAVKYWNFWHQGILFFLWISFDKHADKEPSKTSTIVLALIWIVLAVQAIGLFTQFVVIFIITIRAAAKLPNISKRIN